MRKLLTQSFRIRPTLGLLRPIPVRSLAAAAKAKVNVVFIEPDGERVPVEAEEGTSVLDLAQANEIDLEGACEASLACSTCHVILSPERYASLPEPTDDERDMLDMAICLTDTSRLGCQLKIDKSWEGEEIRLPSAVKNNQGPGF